MKDAMNEVRRWLLVACHFIAPLIFFTNLTRNPYVTQIALIHAGVPLALAAWAWNESNRAEGWRLPRLPVTWPLALFLAAWGASWLRAYLVEPAFFHPAMRAEGARGTWFLLAVSVSTFFVSATLSSEDDGGSDVPLGAWTAFALLWGLAWFGFSALRVRASPRPEDFGSLIWDPYGAFLWVAGTAAAGRLTRRARTADFLHLALCAGFLASAYGILQYFNVDLVWPYTLNPYGGRAVSTFGNPNFLSSFNVALLPIALALFLKAENASRRLTYALLFLTLEAAMLATLTRSSWGGGVIACAALALSPHLRARAKAEPRLLGLILGAGMAMALLWPASTIAATYEPSVVGRLTEFSAMMKRDGAYSPFHQRVLIWASAWLMGSESPLLGKGAGLFELFYPFYQGAMLHAFTFFHNMRTHANNSHNEILEIFSQTGLIGLGAYLAFWTAFFESVRRWAKGRLGEDPLWIGAAAGCAGVLTDNMLNVSMHFAVPAFLFWWLAGVTMGRGARETGLAAPWKGPAWAKRSVFAALALFAALSSWTQVRFWEREAWYFAGFKLVRMGDLPAATSALERSRAWGPREVNALYELGNAYARTGRFADAEKAYREALDANAGYDEIYFNLGTVNNANLGRPAQALKYYEVSWAINPLSSGAPNALSAFYLRDPEHHLDDAFDVLREAVRDFPGDPNHWNNLGYAYTQRRQWAEAEDAYTRALSIAPDLVLAERNLAGLAARSGRPRAPILGVIADMRTLDAEVAARDYSDRTVALAASIARRLPESAKARFLYGSLLLARGRAADAIPELEAAQARESGRAAGHINLGTAYQVAGRTADAVAQFREALRLEPGNAVARQRLTALGAAP
ncbi:MAG: tetratricopeptide repeat protein [Elusimicrobia bacterium]|nr:tetratricopeptide repeat protein [Elusimicrobiota bacterium]